MGGQRWVVGTGLAYQFGLFFPTFCVALCRPAMDARLGAAARYVCMAQFLLLLCARVPASLPPPLPKARYIDHHECVFFGKDALSRSDSSFSQVIYPAKSDLPPKPPPSPNKKELYIACGFALAGFILSMSLPVALYAALFPVLAIALWEERAIVAAYAVAGTVVAWTNPELYIGECLWSLVASHVIMGSPPLPSPPRAPSQGTPWSEHYDEFVAFLEHRMTIEHLYFYEDVYHWKKGGHSVKGAATIRKLYLVPNAPFPVNVGDIALPAEGQAGGQAQFDAAIHIVESQILIPLHHEFKLQLTV